MFIETLQTKHLALWNERVPQKRLELINTIYAGDVNMYDKDFILSGHDAITDFIGKLLSEDPQFYFSAAKPMQVTQNGVRFYWTIQTSGPLLTGMDFFIIENNKVKALYVFMDQAV